MQPDERRALNAAMSRLAAGDRRELANVYARLEGPVRRFCAQMLGGGPDAEDAAQEALTELYRKTSLFDPSRDALSWALTIAAWECRTVRRRRTRARTGPIDVERTSGRDPDPAEASEAKELQQALVAAIGELRPEDRDVLAEVLDEARGDAAFRKRKQRMIERLRALVRRTYDLDA